MDDITLAKGLFTNVGCLDHFKIQNVFDLHQQYYRVVASNGQIFMKLEPRKLSQLSVKNFSNGTEAPFSSTRSSRRWSTRKRQVHRRATRVTSPKCIDPVGDKNTFYLSDIDETFRAINGRDCVKRFIGRMIMFEKKAVH